MKKYILTDEFDECPNNIDVLETDKHFDFDINDYLKKLPNLHALRLGREFSEKINKLPKNLVEFKIGSEYNHKIRKLLSKTKKLEILDLSRHYGFEENVDKILQNTKKLKILKLPGYSEKDITFIPKKVKILEFMIGYDEGKNNFSFKDKLYNTKIEKLKITDVGLGEVKIKKYPKNLKVLELLGAFNQKIKKLPKKLEVLKLGKMFNQKLKLPEGITTLILGSNFKQKLDIPNSLKILQLDNKKQKKLLKNLPKKTKIVYN